ncbi:MAG: hypothetical protein AMXMBFR64_21920 [Myxococcales bacterium]
MDTVGEARTVIVVGGGMAGLSTAWELARAGARVVLVEREAVAGGRLSTPRTVTLEQGGRTFHFPVEHGIHGIWRQYRNLRRLLDACGASRLLAPSGEQALVFAEGDEALHMPVAEGPRTSRLPEPFHQIAMLSPDLLRLALRSGVLPNVRASLDLWHAWSFDPDRDVAAYDGASVETLIGRWPLLLRRLFGALTHTGFFRDPSEVSLAAFFTGLSLYVLGDKRDTAFDLLTEDTQTALIGPLLQEVRRRGEVRLGASVEDVLIEGGHARGVVVDGERVAAHAVVLAVDPPALRALSRGSLGGLLGDAAIPDGLHSQSARIWFARSPRKDRAPMGVWVSEGPDAWFWLHRLQRPYRAWHEATGGSCVECHLYGRRAEEAVTQPDGVVLDRVAAAVERAWPEVSGSRIHADLCRNPPTHVSFEPGSMVRLPQVATFVSNLALCGDFVAARYPVLYLERATLTGLEAARHVAPALGLDPAALPEPLPPFPARRHVRALRGTLRLLRARGLLTALA